MTNTPFNAIIYTVKSGIEGIEMNITEQLLRNIILGKEWNWTEESPIRIVAARNWMLLHPKPIGWRSKNHPEYQKFETDIAARYTVLCKHKKQNLQDQPCPCTFQYIDLSDIGQIPWQWLARIILGFKSNPFQNLDMPHTFS
ncbi:hypothetical protein IIA94_00860, partial [Patescibacteria group bacterium]|nr:hypothetical protein [Patescibacteria group bacterium]